MRLHFIAVGVHYLLDIKLIYPNNHSDYMTAQPVIIAFINIKDITPSYITIAIYFRPIL